MIQIRLAELYSLTVEESARRKALPIARNGFHVEPITGNIYTENDFSDVVDWME
jgi:hypothetical protein